MTKAKAIEVLKEAYDGFLIAEKVCSDAFKDEITDTKIALLTAIDALKAEPVKHGRWIRSDDQCWLTCPFCDTDVDVSCGAPFFYVDNDEVSHINFCPNCGARMDGDNNG